jgi:cytochrome c-type biogenesis protein CcmH
VSLRLVLAVACVALAAAATAAGAPNPADLEAELVCPTCDTTLDQSNAPIAQRMKQIIRERIAAGRTEAEIKAELVDQFGPGVLAEPPKSGFDLLAWVLPLALLAAGALGVGVVAWGWSRRRDDGDGGDAAEAGTLDPDLERRLDAELERFES